MEWIIWDKMGERGNRLFGGIIQLIFIGTGEAFLNAGIIPKPLHGGQQFIAEWLRVLHPGHNIHHQLGIRLQQGNLL